MTGWIIFAAYLAGWAYGSRLALTALMSRSVCAEGYLKENCRRWHKGRSACTSSVGEQRERGLADGALAMAIGLAWPLVIVARFVVGSTPLTEGETRRELAARERRIAEQAADIERLNRMIGNS